VYEIGEEEIEAVARVIRSGRLFRYGDGPESGPTETQLLEREWADHMGAVYCLSVTSGTAALIAGLVGLGVEPGDEVIVPGHTFVATPLAVLAVGAVPVLAEVDASLMLDAEDVRSRITPRTSAVIPVHVLGHVAGMEPILALAAEHGLRVLEDCAQCPGGTYRGRAVGGLGDAGIFSFNHHKMLTAGEGGALITDDAEVIRRARAYHDVGCAWWPDAPAPPDEPAPCFGGVTYRMDELRAAVLRVQLGRLPGILERLRERRSALRDALAGQSAVELSPVADEAGDCGATLFLRLEDREHAKMFAAAARERGVAVTLPYDMERHTYFDWAPLMQRRGAHHPGVDPLHVTEAGRAQNYGPEMLPRTTTHVERTASLDIDINWTDDDVGAAAKAVCEALASL